MFLNMDYTKSECEVFLLPIAVEHAEVICSISNNPELMEIFCEVPSSVEKWIDTIGMWLKDEDEKDYIIVKKSDGQYLGCAGINGLLSDDKVGWIKMIAILPEFWGKGYGSCAVKCLKDIFAQKGFGKVRLWTDKSNIRAQKCYEINGFQVIGEKRQKVGSLGTLKDRLLMECVVSNF